MDNAHKPLSKQAVLPIFEKELRYRIAICLKNSGGTRELTPEFKQSLCGNIAIFADTYSVEIAEVEEQIQNLKDRGAIIFHEKNVATLTPQGMSYANSLRDEDSLYIY